MIRIPALVLSLAGVIAVGAELLGVLPADSHPTGDKADFTANVPADSAMVADTSSASYLTIQEALKNPQRLHPLPPEKIDSETLWLARVIYSESKRPEEQELVAWVVRNRVETRYRGKSTYRTVILDPYQFSAFLRTGHQRPFYLQLNAASRTPGWQRALSIAYYVRKADESMRPFSLRTRHFYSERSMMLRSTPPWATGSNPVSLNPKYKVDSRRFLFFEGIA